MRGPPVPTPPAQVKLLLKFMLNFFMVKGWSWYYILHHITWHNMVYYCISHLFCINLPYLILSFTLLYQLILTLHLSHHFYLYSTDTSSYYMRLLLTHTPLTLPLLLFSSVSLSSLTLTYLTIQPVVPLPERIKKECSIPYHLVGLISHR